MNKRISTIIVILLIAIFSFSMVAFSSSNDQKLQVMVGFKDKSDIQLVQKHGGEIRHTYKNFKIISAKLKQADIEALKQDPSVEYIEPDYKVQASAETLPWGIDRVKAPLVYPQTQGAGVKVAVIDTGIASHEDLTIAGGYSAVAYTTSYADDDGHGTHVAGTIAAVDNELGVIGVAPKVALYAVKALDNTGSGYVSDIVEGINWAIDNKINIINMSLGSSSDSTPLHDACDIAYAKGILIVAAAGNSGTSNILSDNVQYPARYASVIAVAATDSNNARAYFSSTGPDVELCAPGYNITSTVPGGYATYSGTSMASPHVAGVAALVYALNPTMTNVDIRNKLDATATDLGSAGKDTAFGFGIINALNATSVPIEKIVMTSNVATNKLATEGYVTNETVNITVSASDTMYNAVSGATVNLQIKSPANKIIFTKVVITDDGGKALSSYTITRKTGKGIYSISATITKAGYTTTTCSTNFTVK